MKGAFEHKYAGITKHAFFSNCIDICNLRLFPFVKKGCAFLGESNNGFVISDHSDHGASKEPTNPLWTRIHRFLWCTMIRMIWDHKSVFGFSQKNAPKNSIPSRYYHTTTCHGNAQLINKQWFNATFNINTVSKFDKKWMDASRELISYPLKVAQSVS